MNQRLLTLFNEAQAQNRTLLSVLVDPDKPDDDLLVRIAETATNEGADLFFVGGSLLMHNRLDHCIDLIHQHSTLPAILFPGSMLQLSGKADGLLFLSLISGRNPDLLIGHHVIAAPIVRELNLTAFPTGYLLIDSGKATTASYMSGSLPIPRNKPEIAAATAMAGEMLGLRLIYLDAGSGADSPVPVEMVRAVRESVSCPIIVGGGIRDAEAARDLAEAGATVVVVGNAVEQNPLIIPEIAQALHA